MVFGTVEGKVRVGNLKTNKSSSLYAANSMCVALATRSSNYFLIPCIYTPSPDGQGIVSSHADGKLYRYMFDQQGIPNIFLAPDLTKLVLVYWRSILAQHTV